MRSRGLVVVAALLLAVVTGAAMLLYVNGVKKNAQEGGQLTQVIVSTQDIAANTQLDPLIAQGIFVPLSVPQNAVVTSAIKSVDQLKGVTTTQPILQNEQIPSSRLSIGTSNGLGISTGHEAFSIQVQGPQAVAGNIAAGDNITIYGTLDGVSTFKSLQSLLKPAKPGSSSGTAPGQISIPALAVTLIPQVRVLKVENPTPDAQGRTSNGNVTLTLDVTPQDAQTLAYADANATISVALLPPNGVGVQLPASMLPINTILGKKPA